MEDDWIFLGDDGTGSGGSDSDSASASGSDSDSGFAIVRRGRNCSCSVVVSDDAPVAAVAVPQPTLPGLSFKLVSYDEAFSASASSSSADGGGHRGNDEATAEEAIIQGAFIDDAAGTGSTDDCVVTCNDNEGCESDQDGTGSSVEAAASPPSVAVGGAPTVNCPETTAPVLHGEAHSAELASGVDQDGAEEEVDDEDSESCGEDDDVDTENSSEEEEDDDGTDSSGEEDMDTSSSEDEDEDTFSSSDEDYTESFSEDESYLSDVYSDDDDEGDEEDDDDDDAESSGEEEEEEGSESSAEESHDADSTGEEQEEHDDAECSGEVDDVESTGAGEDNVDSKITGAEEGEGDAECSGDEDDVENSGDEPADDDAKSCGEEEEKEDTVNSGEGEESSHVVDVAENSEEDIFALLFPKVTTACDANAEQAAATANATGAVKEPSEAFPSKNDDTIDTDSSGSGSDMDTETSDYGSDMDTESSDMEDDDRLESHEEGDIVHVAENDGNPAIFAMLFPKAKASGANMQDYEEDGSLFDMLLPRDHAIDDDIDADSAGMEDDCFESDEEDDIVDVAENGNHDILAMLRATACHANVDDYEDESEHGSIDDEEEEEEEEELEDGEDEAATATAACGYSAKPSQGTRRPEFAARGYDDVDTDSDMEEGNDEVVAADVNGTSLHGWPRATTTGGSVESQDWGFASQSQTERWWEDRRRQLAAEALESSGQQRSYDDIDDTCVLPGTAAPGGGPSGSCAPTPDAQLTARAEQRDTERALATEEVGRREAAQRELEDESLFDMLLPRDCAIDSSDEEDEAANAATAACGHNAELSQGTRRPEFAGRAARGYDDVDTDSDIEEGDGEVDAADVNGTSVVESHYGCPRPRATTGGGAESQHWGFASQSLTELQALLEDMWRVLELAAEALESSRQLLQQTAEAQFRARAVRDAERALAMEEARRREAAQQEVDRALAREAAVAAEALESALELEGCATAERQATVVTRPAITFIIGVYVLVYLVVSLVSSWLA